jgi:phage shock protein C
MHTKLYRSPTDRMLGGVCGGLGAYLAIDPVLIRLFFVLLTLGGGSGIAVYILMWILIPYPDQNAAGSSETIKAGADEIAARWAATCGPRFMVMIPGPG